MVQTESSKLLCQECNSSMVIPRKRGQRREKGHIKHMYCYHCKEVTGFVEGVVEDKNIAFWEKWKEGETDE